MARHLLSQWATILKGVNIRKGPVAIGNGWCGPEFQTIKGGFERIRFKISTRRRSPVLTITLKVEGAFFKCLDEKTDLHGPASDLQPTMVNSCRDLRNRRKGSNYPLLVTLQKLFIQDLI
jgi:hypothetical protein